ncbi:MAG: carboxypeptidase regulatory-like domain-containing protein, partial [Blastocatellia bacterium]|nr:carboxypeptidase regulatory-like domain-containing protein [Blastocatellia bacterium]
MRKISYARHILRFAGFALIACGFILHAQAQVNTGSILGTVKDNSGAAVMGAKVVVTDIARSAATTYTTDAEGNYNVPFLIPGVYSVAVEAQGFKKSVTNNVVVQLDQKARIDFALEVGQIAEVAEVTAAATLV